MIKTSYLTISTPTEGIYKEKGSKFLAFAFPISSQEEVQSVLEKTKKQFFDARHHCYAYRLGVENEAYRVNDDGEPSGTAGKPIYGQILSNNLYHILLIVVRYFGGIKLGTGGLIQAYKAAAADALSHAEIIEKKVKVKLHLKFDYLQMNQVMKWVKSYSLELISQEFGGNCFLTAEVDLDRIESLYEKIDHTEGVYRLDL